ncbi:amino acid transporter [Mycena latifolia]|nr:amino acid transporter [Mycena latifolia]
MDDSSKFDRKPSDTELVSEKIYVLDVDNAKLAELGYKSEFKSEFGLLETCAFSFSFSIMGIIASVSATFSFGLVSGGHVGLVWGWIIPCFFVMFVALSMAELASSMPTSAGLYYFSAKLAPEKYAPLASWANITGQVCGIDFTSSEMITTAIAVGSDGEIVLSAGATYGILLAILFTHGIVRSAGTRILARLNLIYVVINLGTSLATIIALLVVSGENKETAGAGRAAPIAILVAVGATSVVGWLLLISISFAIPSVGSILESRLPLPMGQVFLDVLGKQGMLAIWSCATVVQYACGAAQGVDASRVVFAFARDNALPESRWWKKMSSNATLELISNSFLVPIRSSIIGLLGFSTAALSSLAGWVTYPLYGLYTSYTTPIFLRVTSGRDKFQPGPFSLGRWSVPIGAIAVAWVAFIEVVLVFPGAQTTTAEKMHYSVVIVMVVFLFASVSWVTSAHKWFHGPVRNIDDVSEMRSV